MTETEWNRLMFWYIHSFLWGRYASATESSLSQDLNIINAGEGIDGLIKLLRQLRGDLKIRPEDFWGWSTGARFYPMLYMLTRVYHSRDWGTGIELNNSGSTPVLMDMSFRTGLGHPIPAFQRRERS